MSSFRRFYCLEIEEGILEGLEAIHCLRVLRLKEHDLIELFDGKGQWAKAKITRIDEKKKRVFFLVLSKNKEAPSPYRITLAQSILKKDSMEWVIEKATEMGVCEIFPIASKHSVPKIAPQKIQRWNQISLSAAKQCRQNYLPKIHTPLSMEEFLRTQKNRHSIKLLASIPSSFSSHPIFQKAKKEGVIQEVLWLIGPEGGLATSESEIAKSSGFQAVSLGNLVLRAEMAALYALCITRYEILSLKSEKK